MSVRGIYAIDATRGGRRVGHISVIDENGVRAQVSNVLGVAPKGSPVRLIVGSALPTCAVPIDDTARTPADPYWTRLVNDYAVQVEGEPEAVRDWSAALGRCLLLPARS